MKKILLGFICGVFAVGVCKYIYEDTALSVIDAVVDLCNDVQSRRGRF